MSRTRNTSTGGGSSNPAAKFLEWDTQSGDWKYWDKGESVEKHLPISTSFIVLDQLNTVKGFLESKQTGIWSNEVRTVGDKLTVRNRDGIVATGTWSDVKVVQGSKFTKSIYAMAKIGSGDYELINFQVKGAALTAWIEFVDGLGGDSGLYGDTVVSIKEATDERKGAVQFKKPLFFTASNTLSDEAAARADYYDNVLQDYLDDYLGYAKDPDPTDAGNSGSDDFSSEAVEPETDLVEAPF
jgi:hypothetical protein